MGGGAHGREADASDERAARVAASRRRTTLLCQDAVDLLVAAQVPHDVTHATVRHRRLRADVLTVHGSGWDLGRYVLWPDASLREAGDRLGWVDEESGEVRLRSDARFRTGPGSTAPAPGGGVWSTCVLVPHLDRDEVGGRTEVVVADAGTSRWAHRPRVPTAPRHGQPPAPARPVAAWPELAPDLADRVRRRAAATRPDVGGTGEGRRPYQR